MVDTSLLSVIEKCDSRASGERRMAKPNAKFLGGCFVSYKPTFSIRVTIGVTLICDHFSRTVVATESLSIYYVI